MEDNSNDEKYSGKFNNSNRPKRYKNPNRIDSISREEESINKNFNENQKLDSNIENKSYIDNIEPNFNNAFKEINKYKLFENKDNIIKEKVEKKNHKTTRYKIENSQLSYNKEFNQNQKENINSKEEKTSERYKKEDKTLKVNKNKNRNKDLSKKGNFSNYNKKQKVKSEYEFSKELFSAIEQNKIINEERMNPWKQINVTNNDKLKFTPLGGLGEIGGNMAVLESKTSAIIIDVGMSFPDETMHGVDILVPDFSHLHKIKNKISAIIITHAHEDHIGAVPYLFKELEFPIYGTPLALAMIEKKFQEHKIKVNKNTFHYIIKRNIYNIGSFKIEWMHMTHSIIDACSMAIQTPIGTIIHTADFKIDHTPIDGQTADLHRFAHYGSQGVLCLFSDSTNSHNSGFTKSEAVVGTTFNNLFSSIKGRIIMSTFSSNVHRIYQAIDIAIKKGKKISVIGRSMEKNINITRELKYVDIPDKHFIEPFELNRYADDEVLVITTGSQGESMAALSRMASGEHRHLKLKETDTIIISANAIPGNEASVSKLMNKILKIGASVKYKDFDNIHVSGHASQEEQKLIIRLVQPKFFLPVHGEYNHLSKHSQTAISCGIDKKNIILMTDGDQIEISTTGLKKVGNAKSGKTFINNQKNTEIKKDIVYDRQKLATEGIINISLQVNKNKGDLNAKPIINSFGIVSIQDYKYFTNDIDKIINNFMAINKSENLYSTKYIQTELSLLVKKHILKVKQSYPIISITIFYN